MKTRFSFIPTVIIALVIVALIGASAVLLVSRFSFPDWISIIFSIAGVYIFFEMVSRLGPKAMEAPSTRFLRLSRKDKVVFVVALVALLAITIPTRILFDSRLLDLVFLGLGFAAFWVIWFFFGSKDIKNGAAKHRHKPRQRR